MGGIVLGGGDPFAPGQRIIKHEGEKTESSLIQKQSDILLSQALWVVGMAGIVALCLGADIVQWIVAVAWLVAGVVRVRLIRRIVRNYGARRRVWVAVAGLWVGAAVAWIVFGWSVLYQVIPVYYYRGQAIIRDRPVFPAPLALRFAVGLVAVVVALTKVPSVLRLVIEIFDPNWPSPRAVAPAEWGPWTPWSTAWGGKPPAPPAAPKSVAVTYWVPEGSVAQGEVADATESKPRRRNRVRDA